MAANVPDPELVHRAKQGELEAFEELTTRYERQIYSLARRILGNEHDAEDVTQVTFISVVEHLKSFREEASFSTWVHRIATFSALKILRKRRGLDTVPLDAALDSAEGGEPLLHPEFIADWSTNPEELVARKEARQAIEDALAELDDKHRPVFVLRDVEGFSVRETAEALQISEANVKVRLLRARLQLREQLTRLFGDPQRALSGHARRHSHPNHGSTEPKPPMTPPASAAGL